MTVTIGAGTASQDPNANAAEADANAAFEKVFNGHVVCKKQDDGQGKGDSNRSNNQGQAKANGQGDANANDAAKANANGNAQINVDADIDVDVDLKLTEGGKGAGNDAPEVDGKVEVTKGRIWGDPHFVGADGGKYDVQGEAGKTYNILSDTGVQMNATFKEWNRPGTTVVEQVGITTDKGVVVVNEDGSLDLSDAHGDTHVAAGKAGTYFDGAVTVADNGKVTVKAGEYDIAFTDFQKNAKAGAWINNIDLRSADANSDGKLPSGLWGATVDGDGKARHGDKGKGTQGGGAIETLDGEITARGDKDTVKLYEVNDVKDTSFTNFNVFQKAQQPQTTLVADIQIDVDIDIQATLQGIVDKIGCDGPGDHGGDGVGKVVPVEHGRVWGDPHFVGADGGKYDVQGEPGKTYNLLSDDGFQMNSTFIPWRGGDGKTVMGDVGITMGSDQIQFAGDGTLTINGQAVEDGHYLDGKVEKRGNDVIVKDEEYDLKLTAMQTPDGYNFVNNIDIRSENANADNVMPHGLWGTTVDGDGHARNGDKGHMTQGGGAIETLDGSITERGDKETVKLYEVGGLFDTNFDTFNKFGGAAPQQNVDLSGFIANLNLYSMMFAKMAMAFDLDAINYATDGQETQYNPLPDLMTSGDLLGLLSSEAW